MSSQREISGEGFITEPSSLAKKLVDIAMEDSSVKSAIESVRICEREDIENIYVNGKEYISFQVGVYRLHTGDVWLQIIPEEGDKIEYIP